MTIRFLLFLTAAMTCLFGCASRTERQTVQAFTLAEGSLVLFNCYVDDRSPEWREEAQRRAESERVALLTQHRLPHDKVVTLAVSMSEGAWANVLLACGTHAFVDQWSAAGAKAAGLKISELRATNNGPSLIRRN